jgi:hypothetical protein
MELTKSFEIYQWYVKEHPFWTAVVCKPQVSLALKNHAY